MKASALLQSSTSIFRYISYPYDSYLLSRALFEATPRWVNTPSPHATSCIGLDGKCESYQSSGTLRVTVTHIALNCRPHEANATSDTAEEGTSPRKRKFAAIAPLKSTTPSGQLAPTAGGHTLADDGAVATSAPKAKRPAKAPVASTSKLPAAAEDSGATADINESDEVANAIIIPEEMEDIDDIYVPVVLPTAQPVLKGKGKGKAKAT